MNSRQQEAGNGTISGDRQLDAGAGAWSVPGGAEPQRSACVGYPRLRPRCWLHGALGHAGLPSRGGWAFFKEAAAGNTRLSNRFLDTNPEPGVLLLVCDI